MCYVKEENKVASNEIQQFARNIDSSITSAIKVTKNDYKERLEAIRNAMEVIPDIVIQMGGVSRCNLAKGAEGEMQRVQREQISAIEKEIKKVDNKLDSLKGDALKSADVVYLTDKLSAWIKRVDEVSIPKGPYSSAHEASASSTMTNILKTWIDFCKNDPTILKASLYEQKAKLEEEINKLTSNISSLEEKIPELKSEYEDRSSNSVKYEHNIQLEVESEVDSIATELRHAQEDASDLEKQEKSIQAQLTSAGLFAFGKKKELKAQLERFSQDILSAKDKVLVIEKKMQSTKDSLPKRISELTEKLSQIKAEIEKSESELENSKNRLTTCKEELAKVKAKL